MHDILDKEPFPERKTTILTLDYSNGFGFKDILLSTITTAAIAEIKLNYKRYAFFNYCKMSLKEYIFAMLMNRAYEQLTAFCDNALRKIITKCVTIIYRQLSLERVHGRQIASLYFST